MCFPGREGHVGSLAPGTEARVSVDGSPLNLLFPQRGQNFLQRAPQKLPSPSCGLCANTALLPGQVGRGALDCLKLPPPPTLASYSSLPSLFSFPLHHESPSDITYVPPVGFFPPSVGCMRSFPESEDFCLLLTLPYPLSWA